MMDKDRDRGKGKGKGRVNGYCINSHIHLRGRGIKEKGKDGRTGLCKRHADIKKTERRESVGV